jgi:hypothetical protein
MGLHHSGVQKFKIKVPGLLGCREGSLLGSWIAGVAGAGAEVSKLGC